MSENPFHLNLPVHLARRDVFYEKATEHLRRIPLSKDPREQRQIAEQTLYLLCESRHHAEAAHRADNSAPRSDLFVNFLDTAVDNTQSIVRMLRRQLMLTVPNNPLDLFLGSVNTGAKMHGHYRRCAGLILKGLLNILREADAPLRNLQQANRAKMSPVDQLRYDKAHHHYSEQADAEAETASMHRLHKDA